MTSTARITTPRQEPIPNPTGAAAVPWERRELMAWWRTPSAQTPTWSLEDDHAAFVATVTAQIAQGVARGSSRGRPARAGSRNTS